MALAVVMSSSPPQVEPVIQRRLTPLVELSRRLAGGPAHPEIFPRPIEESVSVHVNGVPNLESVCKARGQVLGRICGCIGSFISLRMADLGISKSRRSHRLEYEREI